MDGTGVLPRSPMGIVIESNNIVRIANVGVPHIPINADRRPDKATKEIDVIGHYVMPGFINLHAHVEGAKKPPNAIYVY